MGRRPKPNLGTGDILVSGNVRNSVVNTGIGNTIQTNSYPGSREERDNLLEALQQIRAALDGLSGPHAKLAKVNADLAVEEASAGNPDKDAVGGALEAALQADKK